MKMRLCIIFIRLDGIASNPELEVIFYLGALKSFAIRSGARILTLREQKEAIENLST